MSAYGIETAPDRPAANAQRTWDDMISTATINRLIARSNQTHRARLAAARQPHTAAWLEAIPIPSLGLHMDDEETSSSTSARIAYLRAPPVQALRERSGHARASRPLVHEKRRPFSAARGLK